jgi:putative transposase
MKKSRFPDSQIMAILTQHESGVAIADLVREHNVSTASIYQWRAKIGGMYAEMIKRFKDL